MSDAQLKSPPSVPRSTSPFALDQTNPCVSPLAVVPKPTIVPASYERVRDQFSEDELVHLSLAIVAINGWNRLNIAARTVPGDYVAGGLAKVHAAR